MASCGGNKKNCGSISNTQKLINILQTTNV